MAEHDLEALTAAVAVTLAVVAIVAGVILPLVFGHLDRRR